MLDWSGIKAAAIALNSVNAAAIQVGANLPPQEQNRLRERINKRALRERWLDKANQLALSKPVQGNPLPITGPVQNGSDALASILSERKNTTKLHLSKYVQEASLVAANSEGNHKLSRSTKDIADIMGKVWPEQGNTSSGGINLAILTDQVAIQYIDQQPGVSE